MSTFVVRHAKRMSLAALAVLLLEHAAVSTCAQSQQQVWKVPIAPVALARCDPKTIDLPPTVDSKEQVTALILSAVSPRVLVGYEHDNASRIVVCDRATCKVEREIKVPGKMIPMSLSDDGNLMMLRKNERSWERLEFWDLTAPMAAEAQEFLPYEGKSGLDFEVRWAAFLPNNRLVAE